MYAHFSFPKLSITNKILIFSVLGVSGFFLLGRSFGIGAMKYFSLLAVWSQDYFMPWQPVTHFLINPSIWSLLFNCLAIWMFGSVVEQRLGTKRYVIVFAISVLSSAFFFWGLSYPMGLPKAAYFGINSGVLALLFSFAYFWPNSKVYVFGIFPVKSKWLVLVFAAIMLLSSSSSFAGRGKYLGLVSISKLLGMLIALGYVHVLYIEYAFLRSFIGRFKKIYSKEDNYLKPVKSTRNSYMDKNRKPAKQGDKVVGLKDWEKKKVDLLLEKVSKYGINSLDKREKEFLDRVSSNYSSSEEEI